MPTVVFKLMAGQGTGRTERLSGDYNYTYPFWGA